MRHFIMAHHIRIVEPQAPKLSPGMYTGIHNGKKTQIWVTKQGSQIPIKKLSDDHLSNIITCNARFPKKNRKILRVLIKELNRRYK